MKIEIHIYHHLVNDDRDCDVLEALADKLRTSNDKLASAVASNTPAEPMSKPERGD